MNSLLNKLMDLMPEENHLRFLTLIGTLTKHRGLIEDERLDLISGLISAQDESETADGYIDLLEQKLCSIYGVKQSHLVKGCRQREVVDARRVLFWSLRILFGFSLTSIGRRYGKNHATILYGIRTFETLVESDPSFRYRAEICLRYLESNGNSEPLKTYKKKFAHILKIESV
jgi:chromosomal replication initiation ATPase DnaA